MAKGHKGRVAQVPLLAAKHRSRSSLPPSNLSMRCPFTVEASSRIFPHLLQPQGRGKAAACLAGGFQRHGAAKRGAHSPTGTSVTGARGPPAVPGYLLPSVHDASPGGCELCWRVPATGKGRGFCHTIAHVPRLHRAKGPGHILRYCPSPGISHLSSLHPLIHADRGDQEPEARQSILSQPLCSSLSLPAHGSHRTERESRAARREGQAHAAACCQRALVSSHERSRLSEAVMLSNCLDLKIRAI